MATTKSEIKKWIERGISQKYNWMIIVCDTFDYEDYPIYANGVEDFDTKYEQHNNKDLQRIMEVYNLSAALEPQLRAQRSWSYPDRSRFNPNKPKDPILSWLSR